MGIISNIFRSKNHLADRAEGLVPHAKIMAIGSFQPMSEKFDFLKTVQLDDWDYFVTVAVFFIGISRLNRIRISQRRRDELVEIAATHLLEWDRNSVAGFEDCQKFFDPEFDRLSASGHDPRFVAADALGLWIVWNLLKRKPSSELECGLVRAIGGMSVHSVFDWWD